MPSVRMIFSSSFRSIVPACVSRVCPRVGREMSVARERVGRASNVRRHAPDASVSNVSNACDATLRETRRMSRLATNLAHVFQIVFAETVRFRLLRVVKRESKNAQATQRERERRATRNNRVFDQYTTHLIFHRHVGAGKCRRHLCVRQAEQ